jgi:hypothetical protein
MQNKNIISGIENTNKKDNKMQQMNLKNAEFKTRQTQ